MRAKRLNLINGRGGVSLYVLAWVSATGMSLYDVLLVLVPQIGPQQGTTFFVQMSLGHNGLWP